MPAVQQGSQVARDRPESNEGHRRLRNPSHARKGAEMKEFSTIEEAIQVALLFRADREAATAKFPAVLEKIRAEVGPIIEVEFYVTGHENQTYLEHLHRGANEFWLRAKIIAEGRDYRWLFRYFWYRDFNQSIEQAKWRRTVKRVC